MSLVCVFFSPQYWTIISLFFMTELNVQYCCQVIPLPPPPPPPPSPPSPSPLLRLSLFLSLPPPLPPSSTPSLPPSPPSPSLSPSPSPSLPLFSCAVPDLNLLDERLVRLLAIQRVQQLFAAGSGHGSDESASAKSEGMCVDIPESLNAGKHLNGLRPVLLPKLAKLVFSAG